MGRPFQSVKKPKKRLEIWYNSEKARYENGRTKERCTVLSPYYCHGNGQPGIDQVVLIKMVLFAYEAHTVCDKNRFVLSAEVTAGNVYDSVAWNAVYDEVT